MSAIQNLIDANEAREEERRLEKVPVSYFEEYDTLHEAMKLLSDAWWLTEDMRIRGRITRAVGYIRDTALDLIPYGATTPNKGTDGRRYGRTV